MRKLYPDQKETQDLFNRDDNRATKQDIQDLSTQIAATNQTLQNTIDNLQNLQSSLAESLNTNEITAVNASINMLEAASANLTSANIANLTVEELATLKQLTTDLATVTQDLTVGGDVAITGDISAKDATFDELTATSATIANWTIDNLTTNTITAEEITSDAVNATNATLTNVNSDSVTADTANVEDATIGNATITEAAIGLAKIDEVAIENIHWKDYQVYTADSSKLYMVLPHFENGIYFLRAKDGNQNTLFAVEVHNSIDNLFARWSQKEMNWVYRISKVGTGANTQCMLEIHNVDNVAFNLEYATICATPNVPAPTTYTTQPFPGNPMYKVSHQDGNKFFQNVDLANEGTTGAGLTMYATSNWELATTYYNYDGTMGVMSYNYLPNQSLNKEDNVEFYGLNVHDFSTENLNVPGTLKAKHIYDGPQLSAAEKAALPDDTLLIEEGQTHGYAPYAFAVAKTTDPSSLSMFYTDENGHTWKWANDFTQAATGQGLVPPLVPEGADVDYTASSFLDELTAWVELAVGTKMRVPNKYLVKSLEDNHIYVVFEPEYHGGFGGVEGKLVELDSTILDSAITEDNDLQPLAVDIGESFSIDLTKQGHRKVFDMNDEPMSHQIFDSLSVGSTFKLADPDDLIDGTTFVVTEEEIHIGLAWGIPYSVGGGNGKLTRKTTKDGAVQVKPLVPYNENGTSATDDRPLVYDSTDDTIKKATGDMSLPGDLAVAGDETVTGDLTVAGDLNAKNVEFDGNIKAEDLILTGDLEVENDAMFRHDVSISGDLYVDGVEHISDSETTQSSGDYMILRHNNPIPLGSGEKSGIAVHNYKSGGTATLSVDSEGTWRIADNTATSTMHNNLYYYDGKYYDTSFVEQTFVDQIKTAFDEDEIADCVFYNSDSFYHFDGVHWYAVALVNNKLVTDETEVTDAALITALEALTKGPLQYFRKLEITTINEIENEPIFTRDEEANMADKALVQWDAATSKAKTIPLPTMNNQALTAQISGAFDKHILTINGQQYTRYSDEPWTGTIPSGCTETPDTVTGGTWYYDSATDVIYRRNALGDTSLVTDIEYDEDSWSVSGNSATIPDTAVEITQPTAIHYEKAAETTYQWKSNVGGGGLSFVGTRAQYNAAKLIPEGQDGYIGPNTLVTITDEDDYITGDSR